jgi:hypothetical protein
MKDLVHKKCKECSKNPSYGIDKSEYCAEHKKEGMKSFQKKCKEENCFKNPSFGINKREFCLEHKKQNMKRLSNKNCNQDNCNKQSIFGINKREFCLEHKKEGMIDLTHKKCKECSTRPSYGVDKPEYCSRHRKEGMKDLVHKKCLEQNCDKRPSFGIEIPEYCSIHKQEDMKSFQKKCLDEKCNKRPSYGVDKPEYCSEHRKQGMKDLKHKKCEKCDLFTVVKEPLLCSYCNPNKRQKTKENEIEKLLVANNIQFLKDKHCAINNECNKYRPDFLIDRNTFFLIIECDEDAHRQYDKDCEIIRMNNICYNLGLPCVFLRYNPDNKSFNKKEKEQTLLERVKFYLEKEEIETSIEVEYLFY